MPLSLDELREEVLAALRATPEVREVTVVAPDTLNAVLPDEREVVLVLGNLLREAGAWTSAARAERIADFVANGMLIAQQVPHRGDAALTDLVPVVWPADRLAEHRALQRETGTAGEQPLREVLPGFTLVLALDSPQQLMYLFDPDLARLGLDDEAAFALAEQNLRARTEPPLITGEGERRIVAFCQGDALDATRAFVLPDLIAEHAGRELHSPWAAFVPDRDLAVITSLADPQHADQARALCRLHAEEAGSRAISFEALGVGADGRLTGPA